ncbi:hypothetical protein MRB53_041464 [Persea americana]|nr:hypothetical protein MRB53_041464 [Persea americana]
MCRTPKAHQTNVGQSGSMDKHPHPMEWSISKGRSTRQDKRRFPLQPGSLYYAISIDQGRLEKKYEPGTHRNSPQQTGRRPRQDSCLCFPKAGWRDNCRPGGS